MHNGTDPIKRIRVTKVGALTGGRSINRTHLYGVVGTDLGIMAEMGNRIYMMFGDTWGHRKTNWRSNVLAYTTSRDARNGIRIDGWMTDHGWVTDRHRYLRAKELLSGNKDPNEAGGEVTKIPTAMLAIGDRLYVSFMSVRHWGLPGMWDANYATWAWSDDEGFTWETLEPPFWSEASGFIMHAVSMQKGRGNERGDVQILATPSGRFSGVKHARVRPDQLLDKTAYSYYAGTEDLYNHSDHQSSCVHWVSTPEKAREIIPAPVGEGSLLWNAYLDRWIYTYLNESNKCLEVRTALYPWGPWNEPHAITCANRYPALYGAFMTPSWTEDEGRVVYFLMSMFGPYNVYVMRAEFERAT